MTAVGERLARAIPRSELVAILHNDYKVDNCQFAPGRPDRVTSIFDWDMATLGDPLVDLGTLLNYWPDPSDVEDTAALVVAGLESLGLPSRAEVVERYAAITGFDVDAVRWYEAFASWKTAVVLQQLHLRYVRGESSDERMAARGELVGQQARRAATLLDRAGL
jgi:aminoglycoside phosphotransferase (APT) family kinase protein